MRFMFLLLLALGCGGGHGDDDDSDVADGDADADADADGDTDADADGDTDADGDADADGDGDGDADADADSDADADTDADADADADADGDSDADDCAPGTCRLAPDRECELPTGQRGNGCCACGEDGFCSEPCRCAAPDTMIATPDGERPIASLRVGDIVFSVHEDGIVPVPLRMVTRAPAVSHHVIRLQLANGRIMRMSPGHPTADGRMFGELSTGDRLDGAAIEDASLIAYDEAFTYDILPASDTGTYFAVGLQVGSTLATRRLPR
jgi:hypothetical protein